MTNLKVELNRIKDFLNNSGIDVLAIPKQASHKRDKLAIILGRNGHQSHRGRSITINLAAPEKMLKAKPKEARMLRLVCHLLGIKIVTT